MAEETFTCEKCNRIFASKEALEMHKKAKHSESIALNATSSNNTKRKKLVGKKTLILIAILVVVAYFLMQGDSPEKTDFSRAIPIMQDDSHIPVGSTSLWEYNSNPPTSGPHYSTPARPGFRDIAIEDGHLIHSMEHGLIWISYNPRIRAEAEKLRDIVGQFTVITQRDANDEDIAVASWGRLDTFNLTNSTIDAADLDRINAFVNRYANKGPESIPPGQHGGI